MPYLTDAEYDRLIHAGDAISGGARGKPLTPADGDAYVKKREELINAAKTQEQLHDVLERYPYLPDLDVEEEDDSHPNLYAEATDKERAALDAEVEKAEKEGGPEAAREKLVEQGRVSA